MSDDEALRRLLERRFVHRPLDSLARTDPGLLARLNAARQKLAPPRGRHASPRVAQGVLAFRIQGRDTPYPDLKYACYGITLATDWSGRRLIDDGQLIDALLYTVAALRLKKPAQFIACCHALQHAWHTSLASAQMDELQPPLPDNHKIANFLLRHTQPARRRARHYAL